MYNKYKLRKLLKILQNVILLNCERLQSITVVFTLYPSSPPLPNQYTHLHNALYFKMAIIFFMSFDYTLR